MCGHVRIRRAKKMNTYQTYGWPSWGRTKKFWFTLNIALFAGIAALAVASTGMMVLTMTAFVFGSYLDGRTVDVHMPCPKFIGFSYLVCTAYMIGWGIWAWFHRSPEKMYSPEGTLAVRRDRKGMRLLIVSVALLALTGCGTCNVWWVNPADPNAHYEVGTPEHHINL